ncbi:MAG: glycosyltransferase, partial [Candidatus Lokiarchaeota archaeon]|nr:glycosyltransferase [Candidatus Lokiarchaeota archaeon]
TINAFDACDVFLFPSKTDTQGLVLLEAAYAGKPIVMIEDPGLGDIVENNINGFTVPEDIDIFTDKINLLLNDSILYDKMSSNSKIKAEGLTISKQADKLLDVYCNTINDYQSTSLRIKFWQGLSKEIKIPEKLKINKQSLTKIFNRSKNLFKLK